MKERPILFSAPMVRAILDGRKTQTRRVVKGVRGDNSLVLKKSTIKKMGITTHVMDAPKHELCPYGKTGDQLWVRETFAKTDNKGIFFRADELSEADMCANEIYKWTPSIHMPRMASRIDLEITGVRVERLQNITEEDAIAEGIFKSKFDKYFHSTIHPVKGTYQCWVSARQAFEMLWKSINGADSWDANPWVWGIEFKRIRP